MSFRVEQSNIGLQASFSANPVDVNCVAKDDGKIIELKFLAEKEEISVDLPVAVAKQLILQCLGQLPVPPIASGEDGYRERGKTLSSLDDYSLHLLLRDIKDETIAAFLWYLKDAEFTKRVLGIGTRRRARAILDVLTQSWQGKNPDAVPYEIMREGRQAVFEMIQTAWQLVFEGQIPPIPARVEPPFFLSPEEVDDLLRGVTEDE